MNPRILRAVTLTAVLALTAGCGGGNQYLDSTPSGAPMSRQQQYAELMSRPTIIEISARYEEMRGKIQARLTAELGISGWENKNDGRLSGCSNEYPEVESRDVVRSFLSFIIAPKNVSASQWDSAAMIVKEVGAAYGFNQLGLQVSKSPHFELELKDQYHAQLSLSTEKTTVLSVETGCHLTAEAKRGANPTR